MNEKKILKDTRNRITKEKETENVPEEDVIFYVDVAPNGKYYKEKKKIDVSWDERDLKDYADVLYNQHLSGRPVSRRQFNLTPLVDDFYKNNKNVKRIVLHYSKLENKVYVAGK